MKINDDPQARWRTPNLAALVTLQPHIALVLLPWFVIRWLSDAYLGTNRRSIVVFVVAPRGLHGLPLLFDPGLYGVWLERTNAGISRWTPVTPGVFSLVEIGLPWVLLGLVAIGLVSIGWFSASPRFAWTAGLAALPFGPRETPSFQENLRIRYRDTSTRPGRFCPCCRSLCCP